MTMLITFETSSFVCTSFSGCHFWPLTPISGTYGYSSDDLVVLKDNPNLPGHLQPTRVNIVESYVLFMFRRVIQSALTHAV